MCVYVTVFVNFIKSTEFRRKHGRPNLRYMPDKYTEQKYSLIEGKGSRAFVAAACFCLGRFSVAFNWLSSQGRNRDREKGGSIVIDTVKAR